jgi:CRISPR-associated endoribonuclease Cas6
MRFKIILAVQPEVFGSILPISYQFELAACVNRLLTSNQERYKKWLDANGLTPEDNLHQKLYSLSNLYIPKIRVEGDRLDIAVPRVQFWISFHHEQGTEQFVHECFEGCEVVLGDRVSRVKFKVDNVLPISPIQYRETMEYMTLSPIVVIGIRPDNTVEYLSPENPYFAQFIVDELIARYERLNRTTYTGSKEFKMEVISPVKRKGVCLRYSPVKETKIIGYMFRFRLTMDVQLQQLGYEIGLGDKINFGFGYVELINKMAK